MCNFNIHINIFMAYPSGAFHTISHSRLKLVFVVRRSLHAAVKDACCLDKLKNYVNSNIGTRLLFGLLISKTPSLFCSSLMFLSGFS